jgi:hypothetical protein
MNSTSDGSRRPREQRTVAIDLLYGDLSSCGRCMDAAVNLEVALGALEGVLGTTGTRIEVHRTHVRSAAEAEDLGVVSSPTIRVQGREIELGPPSGECGSKCGCGCAPGIACGGEAPVRVIVDAVVAALAEGQA